MTTRTVSFNLAERSKGCEGDILVVNARGHESGRNLPASAVLATHGFNHDPRRASSFRHLFPSHDWNRRSTRKHNELTTDSEAAWGYATL